MTNIIASAPDTIDELFDSWRSDGAENLRVTLLYKDVERTYYFLSKGAAELKPGQEITAGIFLGLTPKKTIAQVVHSTVFLNREVTNGYYFVVSHKEIREETHLLPFRYLTRPLPSVILNRALEERVYKNICDVEKEKISFIEKVGEEGLIRAYVKEKINGRINQKGKELAAQARRIQTDIACLFDDVADPSVLLAPSEVIQEDTLVEALFTEGIPRSRVISALVFPIVAFVPFSAFVNLMNSKKADYKLRFGESTQEEETRLAGEFFMANPRAAKGVRVIYECMKHASNVLAFGVGAGVSYLGYKYATPIVSYPLMCASTLSAVQMLLNVAQSKGHDSSGIISSYYERKLTTRLE